MAKMSLQIEYKNRTSGNGHFFDPDTMKFFHSRIGATGIKDKIWFFITSEKPPYGPRMFSVRRMELDGDINTVGKFCSMTSYQANKLLNTLIA